MNANQALIESLLEDASSQWLEDGIVDLATTARLAAEGFDLRGLEAAIRETLEREAYGS